MIQALAPRMPRGYSWVWPSIVLLGALVAPVAAQQPKGESGSTKKADAPTPAKKKTDSPTPAKKAAEGKDEKKADEEPAEEPAAKAPLLEVFEDPNAEKANENKFPALPRGNFNPRSIKEVRSMASGGNPDGDLIQRYVKAFASDLTNHNAIAALIDPDNPAPPNSSAARGIRDASAALVDPIELAKRANNRAFLTTYTRALLAEAPKLLSNHLVARIETMIALAQTGHPEALDLFVKELNNKDQTVWVKLWAARGITNIIQTPSGGLQDLLAPAAASKAAKALISFLNEDDLPWPAQLRALEALGALRLAADPTAQSKVEMAAAAIKVLADPEARPEVRAQAGWALGMMRVSSAVGKFNYPLIAYYLGEVAADLGERVAGSYSSNLSQAKYWTAPILYQIWPALNGLPGARDSGLLRMPSLPAGDRAFIDQVSGLVKSLAKAAVELCQAPTGSREKYAKELSDRVAALKAFLDKNAPNDKQLVPGVAGGVAGRAPGGGAAGDR